VPDPAPEAGEISAGSVVSTRPSSAGARRAAGQTRQISAAARRADSPALKIGSSHPSARSAHAGPGFGLPAVESLSSPGVRSGAALATDVYGTMGSLSENAPVYSHVDPDVKPPKLLRQQLPSRPAPNALTGYLDFIVDTQGDVESLTLTSPTTRFQDLMMVAAAKAWKFRPAQLAGRPVKYRMRVPITLDGS
jgi:hypothetical protein